MRWWSWPLLLLAAKIDEKPELASEQLVEEAALEAKYFDYKAPQ